MRRALLAATAAIGALALACNLLIGLNQEPTLDNTIGDAQGSDGSGDVVTSDSATDGGVGSDGAVQLLNARVRQIALDDAAVFYTEDLDFVVGRVQKDGTGQVDLVNGQDKTQFYPQHIAVDDVNVFWTSINGIHECAKAGCANTPVDLIDDNADASVTYNPGAIGVDANWVYFVDYDQTNSVAAFRKIPKGVSHGSVSLVTPATALCPTINHMALYGTYLYFTCDEGPVGRAATSNGAVEILSAPNAPKNADRFVSSGSSIFYGEFLASASIYEMPIQADASSSPVALTQPYVNGMDIDGTYLYWATVGVSLDNGGGTVIRCAISGCSKSVQTLASSVDVPTDLKVDSTAIFWSAWGNGSTPHTGLWRLTKPP